MKHFVGLVNELWQVSSIFSQINNLNFYKCNFNEDTFMLRRNTLAIVFILLISIAINAQTFTKKASDAYANKNYKESAALYVKAIENGENEAPNAYNAACSYALFGDKEAAFKLLQKSIDFGYTNVRHMKVDSDLKTLRDDPRWKKIIDEANAKNKASREFWESPAISTPYKENISEDEKLAGLAKLWSEVKYNFANFDLVPDVKWDALFVEYIPKVKQTRSTLEYYKVLSEMISKLRDGHSNVFVPRQLNDSFYSRPLLQTKLIEGRVLITEISADSVRAEGIKIGHEVTEIDGIPAKEYGEKYVMPYQSASTKQDLLNRTYHYYLLWGEKGKPVKLTLAGEDGKRFERELQRYNFIERRKLSSVKPTPPFQFKVLGNNIGYVVLNTFGNNTPAKEFEAQFDEIAKTDALIIDVRNNGGGNSGVGWNILRMLTDKPFQASTWNTREYRPAFRAWGRPQKRFEGAKNMLEPHGKNLYKKPVVILTSPKTFSAAEDFVVVFDAMHRGTIIGEPTGGSTGQPLSFRLPGGGSARVTSKRDKYPDGKKEFVGVGIQPDKFVSPTIKDIRRGRDTVLAAATLEVGKLLAK